MKRCGESGRSTGVLTSVIPQNPVPAARQTLTDHRYKANPHRPERGLSTALLSPATNMAYAYMADNRKFA
jgi:hypothetical protein